MGLLGRRRRDRGSTKLADSHGDTGRPQVVTLQITDTENRFFDTAEPFPPRRQGVLDAQAIRGPEAGRGIHAGEVDIAGGLLGQRLQRVSAARKQGVDSQHIERRG